MKTPTKTGCISYIFTRYVYCGKDVIHDRIMKIEEYSNFLGIAKRIIRGGYHDEAIIYAGDEVPSGDEGSTVSSISEWRGN